MSSSEYETDSDDGSVVSSINDNVSSHVKSELKSGKNSEGASNVSSAFKDNVIKYIKYDDMIREKQQEIKELRASRKKHEDSVIEYMEKKKKEKISIGGGSIVKKSTERIAPLKIDVIKESIFEILKLEELSRDKKDVTVDILDKINVKRGTKTSTTLSRTFEKKPKNKK